MDTTNDTHTLPIEVSLSSVTWEHAKLDLKGREAAEIFQRIGEKRWELVAVSDNIAYFKRRAVDE